MWFSSTGKKTPLDLSGWAAGGLDQLPQGRDVKLLATLAKLADTWGDRAQVRKREQPVDVAFVPGQPDFLPHLLPFADHPTFVEAEAEIQDLILSCGWLAFSTKAINIEKSVVAPACTSLLDSDIAVSRGITAEVVGQTLVDEAYHILLIQETLELSRERRGLSAIQIPVTDMVTEMWKFQGKYSEPWQQRLALWASAVVTEVFITGFLGTLAGHRGIQPLNAVTTKAHLNDELAHASIFRVMAEALYYQLSPRQRDFLLAAMAKAAAWFARRDLQVWDSMFQQIGFESGRKMIADCQAHPEPSPNLADFLEFLRGIGFDRVDQILDPNYQPA